MNELIQRSNLPGFIRGCLVLLILLTYSMTSHAQVRLSADCTTGMADLTGITAANQPPNTSLSWHTGSPASGANKVSNVSAVAAGTYYAAFYDAANSCYSTANTSVTVAPALCLQNTCPSSTVNLNQAVSPTNLPTGTVLSWHTSLPASDANKVSSSTSVSTSGTYYAAFYDSVNSCYSGNGNAATEVIVNIVNCNVIAANPDSGTILAGLGGTVIPNVAANDLINGVPATLGSGGNATISPVGTYPPGITLNPATGSLSVAAGTPPGTYPVAYQLCNKLTPATCTTTTAQVTVASSLTANPDSGTASSGIAIPNVAANDVPATLGSTGNATVAQLGTYPPGITLNPATGSLSVAAGTPPGSYTVGYQLCDKLTPTTCTTTTAQVTVPASAPIATPDIANTNVNTPVSGNVLTNDVDPQGLPLTVTTTPVCQPAHGTVALTASGSYTYTPATSFTGVDSFCYQVCNSAGQCSTATVGINVNPDPSPIANNRPIANNDATQTTQGVPVTVAVLANDSDPDSATSLNGQLANPTLVSQPSVGTAVVNANGTVTYTPPANFTGVVSFPYQVCDKATPALCTTALVSVNVQPTPPANTTLAPVAVDDALITKVNTPKSGNVSTNDSDPQGLPLTYTTGQPTSGTVVMSPTGSYTYTPAPGYVGPDSFTYNVCNSAGKCDKATVSVDVQPAGNQPPVVVPEPLVTKQDTPGSVCLPIFDADKGDTHTASICGQPASGTAAVSVNNTTNQLCVTYTPVTSFTGATTVCVQTCDAAGNCTQTIVPITVIPNSQTVALPQPPSVVVVPIVTPKDSTAQVCMVIKDPNLTDTHSVSVCSSPSKGSTTAVVNNTTHELCVTYKPSSGSVGQDAICLTVCDQTGLCTTVTVPVTIVDPTPPGVTPKPPIVTPTPIVTVVDRPVEVCTGISDNAGDTHTASICGQPASGTVSVGVDNATHKVCVSYSPGSSPVSTTVCVQVCDQGGLCTNVILPITVLPLPKALLLPQAWLQGALYGVTDANGIMRDDLRVKNYLPTINPYGTSPYGSLSAITTVGPISNTATVFGVTGNNAIVDWVFVELRSPSNFSLVVDSRAALIQRDGDIVEIDGVSPIAFQSPQGSYYVAVRHRNHLGVMTAASIPLSLTGTNVDFRTSSTPTYRATLTAINQAQVSVAQGVALWAGNVLYDKSVIYQSTGNDVSAISQQVKGSPSNITGASTYILQGYSPSDVNMDGRAIYQGTGNDVNYIYQNVTKNHPGNVSGQNFFIIREQLP